MKSVNIRTLKQETGKVLDRVGRGETLEIRRRNEPLAILKPIDAKPKPGKRPDYRHRLQVIYGDLMLPRTATELLADERGER